MVKSKEKSKEKRLEGAALVKIKYQMETGVLDEAFWQIYRGVLEDLNLTEEEVEKYILANRLRLEQLCREN